MASSSSTRRDMAASTSFKLASSAQQTAWLQKTARHVASHRMRGIEVPPTGQTNTSGSHYNVAAEHCELVMAGLGRSAGEFGFALEAFSLCPGKLTHVGGPILIFVVIVIFV